MVTKNLSFGCLAFSLSFGLISFILGKGLGRRNWNLPLGLEYNNTAEMPRTCQAVASIISATGVALGFLLVGGCTSIANLNSDYFEAGHSTFAQFENDDAVCAEQARLYVSSDPRVLNDTSYGTHRAYNGSYSRCMIAHGHVSRPYWKNLVPIGHWW